MAQADAVAIVTRYLDYIIENQVIADDDFAAWASEQDPDDDGLIEVVIVSDRFVDDRQNAGVALEKASWAVDVRICPFPATREMWTEGATSPVVSKVKSRGQIITRS